MNGSQPFSSSLQSLCRQDVFFRVWEHLPCAGISLSSQRERWRLRCNSAFAQPSRPCKLTYRTAAISPEETSAGDGMLGKRGIYLVLKSHLQSACELNSIRCSVVNYGTPEPLEIMFSLSFVHGSFRGIVARLSGLALGRTHWRQLSTKRASTSQ